MSGFLHPMFRFAPGVLVLIRRADRAREFVAAKSVVDRRVFRVAGVLLAHDLQSFQKICLSRYSGVMVYFHANLSTVGRLIGIKLNCQKNVSLCLTFKLRVIDRGVNCERYDYRESRSNRFPVSARPVIRRGPSIKPGEGHPVRGQWAPLNLLLFGPSTNTRCKSSGIRQRDHYRDASRIRTERSRPFLSPSLRTCQYRIPIARAARQRVS